jgi:hypothetical protein
MSSDTGAEIKSSAISFFKRTIDLGPRRMAALSAGVACIPVANTSKQEEAKLRYRPTYFMNDLSV